MSDLCSTVQFSSRFVILTIFLRQSLIQCAEPSYGRTAQTLRPRHYMT